MTMIFLVTNIIATIITVPKIFCIVLGENFVDPINDPKYPPIKTATISGRNANISIE